MIEKLIASLLLIGILGLFFYAYGTTCARKQQRTEAVSLGHAEWSVSTNGVVTFKWKECDK